MTEITPRAGWARMNSLIEIGAPTANLGIQEIADRILIAETVNRFGWSYDERDIDALVRTFAVDASYEGTVAGSGSFGPYAGRESIITWFTSYMSEHDDLRRHRVTNLDFVRLDEAACRVNAYVMLNEIAHGAVTQVTSGFYRIDLVKQADGWVFKHVFAGFDNSY